MLEETNAITGDDGQARAIFGSNEDADFLGQAPKIEYPEKLQIPSLRPCAMPINATICCEHRA